MKDSSLLPRETRASGSPVVRRGANGRNVLRQSMGDRLSFLRAFLLRPASVGALGPSSSYLAEAMLGGIGIESRGTVVELGPGTGAFTGLILRKIGSSATFFALELDGGFARCLRSRFPSLTVYNDSAERMREYLSRHGKSSVDCIVSGLPWASLPLGVQDRIFEAVLGCLAPGGVFATFGYLHARWLPNALRFRRRLEASFRRVEVSRTVWRNFPPAFIYRCQR